MKAVTALSQSANKQSQTFFKTDVRISKWFRSHALRFLSGFICFIPIGCTVYSMYVLLELHTDWWKRRDNSLLFLRLNHQSSPGHKVTGHSTNISLTPGISSYPVLRPDNHIFLSDSVCFFPILRRIIYILRFHSTLVSTVYLFISLTLVCVHIHVYMYICMHILYVYTYVCVCVCVCML